MADVSQSLKPAPSAWPVDRPRAEPSSPRRATITHTSNPRHETRDAALIAIAEDMIARTSMSQDGFAERLNIELNLRAERCRAKDYPDLKALEGAATSHVDYARIYKNWSKRVERWLDGDVEIPAWIEESWVQALEQPGANARLELSGRYGLLRCVQSWPRYGRHEGVRRIDVTPR